MRVFDDRITFWNLGTLPKGYTPETLFQPHDSQPRNRLIANAFYMAGFIEAWGRGFEIITDAFKREDLEVPTLVEEFGGVRVIIKREIFYAIQHGGRIDPKTGRLVKGADTKADTNNDTKKITERQRVIYSMLPIGVTEDDTKKEALSSKSIAAKLKVSVSTIKRDMKVLQKLRLVEHVGPSNGGYWKRLQ